MYQVKNSFCEFDRFAVRLQMHSAPSSLLLYKVTSVRYKIYLHDHKYYSISKAYRKYIEKKKECAKLITIRF